MAMRYGLFDSTEIVSVENGIPVGNRSQTADFFARYFKAFLGSGVYGKDDEFRVVVQNSRELKVMAGQAFLEGYYCFDDEPSLYQLSDSYAQDTSLCAVLRLSYDASDIQLVWIADTPGLPLRSHGFYDLILARVFIPAGTVSTDTVTITDTRNDSFYCGRVQFMLDHLTERWAKEMKLSLSGGCSGSVLFDGSKDKFLHVTGLNMEYANHGVLTINNGGTGASSTSEALEKLGAAPLSHKTDAGDITAGVMGMEVVASDGMDEEPRLRNFALLETLPDKWEGGDGVLLVVYGLTGRGIYLTLSGRMIPIALYAEE